MKKKKAVLYWVVLCSFVILLFAFGTSPAAAKNVIQVGSIQPLTGPAAPWGLPVDRGIHIMAEIINENGGVTVKGKKYEFKILSENCKFSSKGARAAAEKLINQKKVKFIVGPFADPTVLACRNLIMEKKVIMIQGTSANPHTIGPKYPYLFRFSQDARGKLGVCDIALEKLKFSKMGILNVDSAVGRGNSEQAAVWAEEKGVELTDNILAPVGTKDFYPFLKKIIDHKVGMIHSTISPRTYALVCKQAHELGYRGLYSNIGSMTSVEEFIEIGGKEAVQNYIAPFETMDCPAITPKHRKMMKKIKAMYLKKHGPPFEPIAWRYTIALDVLKIALEKAQSFDPDVLVKALENTEFDTLLGKGRFKGQKTYGIPRQLVITTVAGIIKGDKAEYFGYVVVERP